LAQNQPPEPSPESLVAYLAKKDSEISNLQKELAEVKARRNVADKEYARKHPEPTETSKIEEKKEEPPKPPHFTGSWQKWCPTCGDTNPNFKDETICSTPGCGQHLGAEEGIKDLKACPNCGGHKYDKIKAD
jgi:hypothetical protein